MIDYVYLILILILIGFILFIIYLSYEYRVKEGFIPIPSLAMSLDITKNYDTLPQIINQANTFNNNYISAINDGKILQQNKDYKDQLEVLKISNSNLQNSQTIINLQNKLNNSSLPSNSFPVDKLISTIKSNYNSQYLSTFANDASTYGVLVNDKCMTVNGLCKEDYCLLECKNNLYSSDTQKFTTKRIYSDSDAAKVMNMPVSSISNNNVYPFNIFSSVVNNKCLTIGDAGLTIEKCNLNNIKQQWSISPDANICLID
jgi:hypothetical protein